MTTLEAVRPHIHRSRLEHVAGVARAAMFAVAIGVFLAAPPSLPWVIALVAATNVVAMTARAWRSGSRPPLALLVLNGMTITLVIGLTVLMSSSR